MLYKISLQLGKDIAIDPFDLKLLYDQNKLSPVKYQNQVLVYPDPSSSTFQLFVALETNTRIYLKNIDSSLGWVVFGWILSPPADR